MENGNQQNALELAVATLRGRPQEIDFSGFEHGVWNEIAIRDEGRVGSCFRLLGRGRMFLSAPTAAVCASVAVAAGIVAGLHQANVYERDADLSLEQRYVESIHPVMMSNGIGRRSDGPTE